MPEKLEQAIVYFGPGAVWPGKLGRKIKTGEKHWLVEPNPEILQIYKRAGLDKRDDIEIIPRQAQDSQLPAGFAHEVHAHNLLTERPGYRKTKQEILAEAKRILRDDGAI